MQALVTGARGFIGRHLADALEREGHDVIRYGRGDAAAVLDDALDSVDVVFHLAGVNRPDDPAEFERVNVGLTDHIAARLAQRPTPSRVIFASSTQAALDNPYGRSKLAAEQRLRLLAGSAKASVVIFRLPGVFGRGGRPRYNSVVATFCDAAARGETLTVNDRSAALQLAHVDDVVRALVAAAERPDVADGAVEVEPVFRITVGELADRITAIANVRRSLVLPDLADPLTFRLYATFLTYLAEDDFGYSLTKHEDPRGSLAEFVKSPAFGQIFVSRTNPGITRGNHWHTLKAEKFLVVEGNAVIRFRKVDEDSVLEYPVAGTDYRVVDIPPGYTHSIENVGSGELVVLFWASEIFDPSRPDTSFLPVLDA